MTVTEIDLGAVDRAITQGDTHGFAKLVRSTRGAPR